eukprot:403345806
MARIFKNFKFLLAITLAFFIQKSSQSHIIEGHDNFFELFFSNNPELKAMRPVIELGWTLLNQFDFCLFPKEQSWSETFWVAFLRHYGLSTEMVEDYLNTEAKLQIPYQKKQGDEPRIPRKTHRVWVTDSINPTECMDSVKNDLVFQELLETNNALEATGHKWEHYLWTNDIKAIPKTVKWFEEHGMKVRELHTLPSYDEVITKSMDKYMEFRFGAAADIARQVILYDEGGLYLDIDAFIKEWDDKWLYYFDSLYWKDVLEFENLIVFTYQFLTIPHHPIQKAYLDYFKESYVASWANKPVHIKFCYADTKGITLWETGPFFLTLAYLKGAYQGTNQDICLFPENTNSTQIYTIKDATDNNSPVDLKYWGYQIGLGSWGDDFTDTLMLGFMDMPELD